MPKTKRTKKVSPPVTVYVDGDKDKKPVDASKQPVGARLVLVSPHGRDVHFIQGKHFTVDKTKQKERFAKARAAFKAKDKSEG